MPDAQRTQAADREVAAAATGTDSAVRVGAWSYDFATGLLSWSKGTHAIHGTSPEHFQGTVEEVLALMHPDDRGALIAGMGRAECDGSVDVEYRIVRPDGSVRWLHGSGEATPSGEGAVSRILGVVADITDRREAEEHARRSAALERMASRVGRIGGWTVELPSGKTAWSDEVCAIHGVAPGTIPDEAMMHRMLAPADREQLAGAVMEARRSGKAFDLETEILAADGQRKWVRIIGEALRDGAGRITSVQGAFQDLTSWKQMEKSVEASRRMFRDLADAMPAIVWTARPDGVLDFTNSRMFGYTGCAPTEPPAQGWLSAVHPDDVAECVARWAAAVSSGQPYEHEFRLRRNDGVYRWHYVTAVASLDDAGAVLRWIGAAVDIEDKRQVMEALTRANARLYDTLESISDAFYTVDDDWRFTYINNEAERALGIDRAEALGQSIWALFPDVVGTELETQFREAAATRQTVTFETYYAPFGRWYRASLFPAAEGLSVYFQDISEQREVAARLQLMDTAIARMNDVVMITDADTIDAPGPIIRYVNDAFERMTGYHRDEVIGLSPRFLQGPGTDRYQLDRVRTALAAKRPVRAEMLNYTKDGDEIWIELDIAPILDRDGNVLHYLSVQRDVTERKLVETELREREERFRGISKVIADTIWDWDLRRDVIWWGEGLKARFGYDPSQVDPSSEFWISRVHPDDREAVVASLDAAMTGSHERWQTEYRFARADGIYANVIDRGYLIRDEAGRATRMVGGLSDVSESVALEAKVRQGQRLESVGKLTGGVAHDFNNLLTVILGNSEALADQLSGQPALHDLAQMTMKAAERGSELTGRLLAFARQQPLEPAAIDVNTIVAGMESLLRRTLSETIDIRIVLGDGLWTAFADAGQLENALLNLVLNARDAMASGGQLLIETANVQIPDTTRNAAEDERPGSYVMLAVSDNGTGMTQEVLSRVFEPFFTTKPFGSGSGLGLSMVYGYAKQSNGHVRIYSEPGQGTTVRLLLPRVPSAGDTRVAVPATAARLEGGSERILIVEDDAMVRQLVEAQLSSLGYETLAAGDGRTALDVLEGGAEIDLLFTDVIMPGGISGRKLAEEALRRNPRLKVLFTSGYTENAIIHQGRLEPGVSLLQKPYTRAELGARIRAALD